MHKKLHPRVGIYAGTFDPVHVGHIAFALQAMAAAQLDEVVFLPERAPRRKHPAEHYAHRVAMLKRALRPHPAMSVLELADKRFTVQRTWPQLQTTFASAQLVMLVGSDVLAHFSDWPQVEHMLRGSELVVGVRSDDDEPLVRLVAQTLSVQPKDICIIQSHSPHVSSTTVRSALAERSHTRGLLASVHAYARSNWLYVSIEHAVSKKI